MNRIVERNVAAPPSGRNPTNKSNKAGSDLRPVNDTGCLPCISYHRVDQRFIELSRLSARSLSPSLNLDRPPSALLSVSEDFIAAHRDPEWESKEARLVNSCV
jgi:hypothetical protein